MTGTRKRRHDLQSRSRIQAQLLAARNGFLSILSLAAIVAVFQPNIAGAVVAPPIKITPHRAAYLFEMISSDPSGGVANVSGGMTFEWADACDGWALDQNYLLQLSNSDGSRTEIQTSSASWESKDGLRYRFIVKRGRDGKLVEDLRGKAKLGAPGASGAVEFSKPAAKRIPLPAGTRFPTNFMLDQMRAAKKDSRMAPSLVFEGAAMEGPQTVTTTILPQRAPRGESILKAPLGPSDIWPMYVAYFPADKPDGNPETEVSIDVQANGIVPEFVLDYGIFKLRAVLAKISALPPAGC